MDDCSLDRVPSNSLGLGISSPCGLWTVLTAVVRAAIVSLWAVMVASWVAIRVRSSRMSPVAWIFSSRVSLMVLVWSSWVLRSLSMAWVLMNTSLVSWVGSVIVCQRLQVLRASGLKLTIRGAVMVLF